MIKPLLAVFLGAAIGGVLRWLISLRLNLLFPHLPPGTLLVNLVGGLIIGGAMAWFCKYPQIDPAWKLFIITGFCGGLTTFSTFSAEIMLLLQGGKYLWALGSILLHVTGSVVMTIVGFILVNVIG